MRKSKLLAGQYNVYAVYDKISKHYQAIYYATTDEEFIRKYLPGIIAVIPLRDLTISKIGIFNDVTGEIKQTVKKHVDTACYCFPHSRLSPVGENVKLSELEEHIDTTKNEIKASFAEIDSKEGETVNE